jgi:ketosteroid isomerase-like protein
MSFVRFPGFSQGTGTEHKKHKQDTKSTGDHLYEMGFCASCVPFPIPLGSVLPSLLLALAVTACVPAPETVKGIRSVMEAQQAAWNRGDIEGFMDGYERAETTTFVSGDELTRGWQTVLDRYKQRYKSRDEMGTLTFSDLDIKPINGSYALADGRWQLTRANDKPHGRFTLLFHRAGNEWRIVHDTTTSAAP